MDQTAFEIWAYRSIILLLIAIVGFTVRTYATKVTDKLDALITAINDLSSKYVGHDERIKSESQRIDEHAKRLDDHSKRLRVVEQKTANAKD